MSGCRVVDQKCGRAPTWCGGAHAGMFERRTSMSRGQREIVVSGARDHNLKGVDLRLPRGALVTMTGVSGSGKSSLAFDTIFQEGQRRFVESLSSYARQFLGQTEKPKVDHIEGLSPTISIDQKTANRSPGWT